MVIRRDWWHAGHRLLTGSQAFFGVYGAILSAVIKYDVTKLAAKPLLSLLVTTMQESAWYSLPMIATWLYLAQLAKRYLGSPYYVWDVVKYLLDELRNEIFDGNENSDHNDRVTLFQHKKFHLCWRFWPGSGWLVPSERSGHVTRKSAACFRAPDDADNAEGIVGNAWAKKLPIFCDNLPNVTKESGVKEIRLYAQRTFCNEKFVAKAAKKRKSLPRSLCAIPVEVKGKVWGVIVIDSRNPTMMDKNKITAFYEKNAKILNKLLEKV